MHFARKSAILHAFYVRVGAAIPVASTVIGLCFSCCCNICGHFVLEFRKKLNMYSTGPVIAALHARKARILRVNPPSCTHFKRV